MIWYNFCRQKRNDGCFYNCTNSCNKECRSDKFSPEIENDEPEIENDEELDMEDENLELLSQSQLQQRA